MAPAESLNIPAGQSMHVMDEPSLNVPTPHSEQDVLERRE
jgi:hypothetical protein